MVKRLLRGAGIAALASATLALAGPAIARANTAPPAKFFQKNIRLNVNLQDVQSLVFDAGLNEIPGTVPAAFADYLQQNLDVSFEVDATKARCFIVASTGASKQADCSHVSDLVDAAPDGGVDAIILAKPVVDSAGDLGFVAKKITVWADSSTPDTTPAPDPTPAPTPGGPPAKLFKKNVRLSVTLQDTNGLVFDAALNDALGSVPYAISTYLKESLDATFEVDATAARCFLVQNGAAKGVPCQQVADLVDGSPDGGIDVTILAKPTLNADGSLGFVAKKITVSQ